MSEQISSSQEDEILAVAAPDPGTVEQIAKQIANIPEKRIGSVAINHILFVILDQSSDLFYNTKKTLSSVSANVAGAEVFLNAYNPFSSGKLAEVDGPQGVLRAILTGIFATINKLVDRNVVFVGQIKNTVSQVNLLAGRITQALSTASVFKATDILVPPSMGEVVGDEPAQVELPPISFADVFKVASWVDFKPNDEGLVDEATVYTTLTINSGAMYDTRDPQKHVERAMNILTRSIEHIDPSLANNVFVGVLVNSPALINDSRVHDLALNLADTAGFDAFSLREAAEGRADWLPSTACGKLFSPTSDLLLFRPLVQEEEEEELDEDTGAE